MLPGAALIDDTDSRPEQPRSRSRTPPRQRLRTPARRAWQGPRSSTEARELVEQAVAQVERTMQELSATRAALRSILIIQDVGSGRHL